MNALAALLDECPIAAAAFVRAVGEFERLLEFFASPFFAACIDGDSPGAIALTDFLAARAPDVGDPRVAALASLEGAVASLRRRASRRALPPGHVRTAATIRLLRLPSGTGEAFSAAMTAFRASGLTAAKWAHHGAANLRAVQGEAELAWILIASDAEGEQSIETVPEALGTLLDFVSLDRERSAVLDHLAEAGLDAAEADALLDDLHRDGLIVAGRAP